MNSAVTKRAACDRCRDQKLRCPRVNSATEPCSRCLRAHAICVTSSSRPNGRPRISPLPVAERIPTGSGVNSGVLGLTSARPSTGARSANGDRTPAQANVPLWSPSASFDAYPEFFSSSAFPSTSHTVLSVQGEWSKSQTSSPGPRQSGVTSLVELQLLGDEHDGELNAIDLERSIDVADGGFLENIANYDHNHSVGGAMQPISGMGFEEHNVKTATLVDPRIRLSKLSEVVVQQLNRVGTYSWHPSQVPANCTAKGQGTDQNPLAQVLQSNSELAAILQQMSCGGTDHAQPDPAVSVSASPLSPSIGDPLSTSTILLVLATWLQLLELYDKLFGHFRATLQEMPFDAITAFRGPTGIIGLRVPGMSLMQGDLSIKIMIQVINHQLETVEALLGLPEEYCVVRRSGTGIGKTHAATLFSSLDVEVSGLLQTVMKDMPSGAGKATITSLGDKIKAVQGIVGM